MAKEKVTKGSKVPNKVLNSRISFLYQAAAFYVNTKTVHIEAAGHKADSSERCIEREPQETSPRLQSTFTQQLSRDLLHSSRAIALKTQIRLSPAFKHTICQRCNSLLMDGSTCINEVENTSKGRKKHWADVLVRRCKACGYAKRFPMADTRQQRRPNRIIKAHVVEGG